MRNRITWENVAAPDFRDAIAGVRVGGEMVTSAFKDAGAAIKDIGANRNKQASSAAMAKAMGITDPAEWDAFLKAGGPASLGISPDRLTDEALAFFRDRGQALLDEDKTGASIDLIGAQTDETIATTGLRKAQIGETLANTDRISNSIQLDNAANTRADTRLSIDLAREADQNAARDLDYKIAEESYNRGKLTSARATNAQNVIDDLADRSDITSVDQLKSAYIALDPDAESQKIGLDYIGGMDPVIFSATDEEIEAAQNRPMYQRTTQALGGINSAIDYEYGGDTMLDYYTKGVGEQEGNTVLDTLVGEIVAGRDKAEASQWAGTVVNMHRDLVKESGLAPEVVAAVMADSLKGGMTPGWDLGDLKIDRDQASEVLKALGSPVERVSLENKRVQMENDRREVKAVQRKIDNAAVRLAKAEARGDNRGATKALQDLMGAEKEALRLSKKWQPQLDTKGNVKPRAPYHQRQLQGTGR